MGRRKYPPLTPSEVKAILQRLGFVFKNQEGSHAQYEHGADDKDDQRRVVTVDEAEKDFGEFLMKNMIRQSGRTREQFYGATKGTARKASVDPVKIQKALKLEAE